MRGYKATIIFITALVLVCLLMPACKRAGVKGVELPYYNSPDFTPYWQNASASAGTTIHTISPFVFTNQQGQPFGIKNLQGKIHVADFFFTSCGSICPKLKNSFKKVQKAFLNDSNVVLVSFTVAPEVDSVARLKKYGDNNGIIPGKWQLLTGRQNDIYAIARKAYFAEEAIGYNKDSTEFLHTEHIVLVDKNLRIRGIYNGTLPLEEARLEQDIHALEDEDN